VLVDIAVLCSSD